MSFPSATRSETQQFDLTTNKDVVRCHSNYKHAHLKYYLLTYAHCSVLSIGRQQMSSSAPYSLPTFFASSSTDLCHVFLGLPLFLFPAGFQLRACLVISVTGFLRVCPIYRHFLFLMMSLTGSCCDLLHNSK